MRFTRSLPESLFIASLMALSSNIDYHRDAMNAPFISHQIKDYGLRLLSYLAKQDYSTSTYIQNIREQRYVNGKLNGYCSRLHYFSEWLDENQKRNIVKSLTSALDGVPINKTLNFMSTHWQAYPQLAHSEAHRQCISEMESTPDNASIRYIPTDQIQSKYASLESGDVIAIATKIPGLDVAHTGLIYRSPNGDIGLIHSAPVRGVMISPNLQRYVNRVDDAIGILVARPVDPRTL